MDSGKVALFCIEHHWEGLWLGLYLFETTPMLIPSDLGSLDTVKAQKISADLEILLDIQFEMPEDGWFAWRFFSLNGEDNFGSDKLNYALATDMVNCVEQLVNEVMAYLAAFKQIIAKYQNSAD